MMRLSSYIFTSVTIKIFIAGIVATTIATLMGSVVPNVSELAILGYFTYSFMSLLETAIKPPKPPAPKCKDQGNPSENN